MTGIGDLHPFNQEYIWSYTHDQYGTLTVNRDWVQISKLTESQIIILRGYNPNIDTLVETYKDPKWGTTKNDNYGSEMVFVPLNPIVPDKGGYWEYSKWLTDDQRNFIREIQDAEKEGQEEPLFTDEWLKEFEKEEKKYINWLVKQPKTYCYTDGNPKYGRGV